MKGHSPSQLRMWHRLGVQIVKSFPLFPPFTAFSLVQTSVGLCWHRTALRGQEIRWDFVLTPPVQRLLGWPWAQPGGLLLLWKLLQALSAQQFTTLWCHHRLTWAIWMLEASGFIFMPSWPLYQRSLYIKFGVHELFHFPALSVF